MERKLCTRFAAGKLQLARQTLFVDTDAHRRDFKGALQNRVPHQNIAVERPVVIVGRASVVGLAGFQLAADLHEKHRMMLAQDRVFALLGGLVGIQVLQLLGRDEEDLAVQLRVKARESDAEGVIRLADRADNVAHGALEIGNVAVFARDDLFPVPLVDVDGVEVVDLLVTPDGVHIGKQALADVELVALQRQPLPLGQRMHDLRLSADVRDVETDRALIAVQIVVQAGSLLHEQRRGYAAQIQRVGQIRLEIALDEFNGALQLVDGQGRVVALRDRDLAHGEASLSYEKFTKYYTPVSPAMQAGSRKYAEFLHSASGKREPLGAPCAYLILKRMSSPQNWQRR